MRPLWFAFFPVSQTDSEVHRHETVALAHLFYFAFHRSCLLTWSLLDCEVFRRHLLLWVHCSISEMRSLFLLSFVGGAWLYSFIIFVPSVLKVSLLEIICFPFVQTRQMRLNYVINPIYVSLQKLPMHNFLAHSNYVSVQCLRKWMMTIPILANENIWTCLGSETVDYVLTWFNSSMAPVNYWFSVPWAADPKALKYQP